MWCQSVQELAALLEAAEGPRAPLEGAEVLPEVLARIQALVQGKLLFLCTRCARMRFYRLKPNVCIESGAGSCCSGQASSCGNQVRFSTAVGAPERLSHIALEPGCIGVALFKYHCFQSSQLQCLS